MFLVRGESRALGSCLNSWLLLLLQPLPYQQWDDRASVHYKSISSETFCQHLLQWFTTMAAFLGLPWDFLNIQTCPCSGSTQTNFLGLSTDTVICNMLSRSFYIQPRETVHCVPCAVLSTGIQGQRKPRPCWQWCLGEDHTVRKGPHSVLPERWGCSEKTQRTQLRGIWEDFLRKELSELTGRNVYLLCPLL